MIVREDDAGGVVAERSLHYLSRIDARLRKRSAKELLRGEQAILRIEKKRDEYFVRAAAEREQQEVAHRTRRRKAVALADVFDQRAPQELEHGLELRVFRDTEAANARNFIDGRGEQALETAEMREQFAPEIDGARARDPRAKENGEELRFGQRRRAVLKQAFAGTFSFRPISDAHGCAPIPVCEGILNCDSHGSIRQMD